MPRRPKAPAPQDACGAKLREVRDAELNEEAGALFRRLESPEQGGAYPTG